jgi:flavin reductase (DIM6/NTAB) family NADH-FMN oxidoreductase RutF
VSTVSKDGSQRNLAPFSYTQVVNHDPPVFCIGFSAGRNMKDTARHLLESGECTINIISDFFIEAANYTAINAPPGVSEWGLSGLTPEKSTVVSAPRVKESVFSIEAKLLHSHDWKSKTTGNHTGTLCIVEGVYFHVREDALNDEQNIIDIDVLRPMSRLGGIMYGRTTSMLEIPRPDFTAEKEKEKVKAILTKEYS